jgi:hypothetical protein
VGFEAGSCVRSVLTAWPELEVVSAGREYFLVPSSAARLSVRVVRSIADCVSCGLAIFSVLPVRFSSTLTCVPGCKVLVVLDVFSVVLPTMVEPLSLPTLLFLPEATEFFSSSSFSLFLDDREA